MFLCYGAYNQHWDLTNMLYLINTNLVYVNRFLQCTLVILLYCYIAACLKWVHYVNMYIMYKTYCEFNTQESHSVRGRTLVTSEQWGYHAAVTIMMTVHMLQFSPYLNKQTTMPLSRGCVKGRSDPDGSNLDVRKPLTEYYSTQTLPVKGVGLYWAAPSKNVYDASLKKFWIQKCLI